MPYTTRCVFSVFSIAAIYLCMNSCDKSPSVLEKVTAPFIEQESKELPYDTTLVDRSGRSIDVTLLKREDSIVSFTKSGSDRIYHCNISNLSTESTELISTFPLSSSTYPTVPTVNPRLKARNERIQFLEKKYAELRSSLEKYTGSSFKQKSIKNDMRRVSEEISELKIEISKFQ